MLKELLPEITIIIPVYNEIEHIDNAYLSLCENGYPLEKIEFIFIDGGSSDQTFRYLQQVQQQHQYVTVLNNPDKITPISLNLGIQAASKEIILRADSHAIYHKGYIEASVTSLIQGKGDNIGGQLVAVKNKSRFSRLLAIVLNSPIGGGAFKYKSAPIATFVDTVWCGCWYKKTLNEIGGFDPKWVINQDYELNLRLRKLGKNIYYNPAIQADYIVRDCLSALVRQYFNYGRGRAKTLIKYPESLKLRQVAPPLFVLSCLLLLLLSPKLFVVSSLVALLVHYWFRARLYKNKTLNGVESIGLVCIAFVICVSWSVGLFSKFLSELQQRIIGKVKSVVSLR